MIRFKFVLYCCIFFIEVNAQSIRFDYGAVKPSIFFIQIPYRMISGKLIISATVDGKVGNFVLDTGAPNTVSSKFAAALDAKTVSSTPIIDVNENRGTQKTVEIASLKIGNVVFEKINTLVSDSYFLSCFEADGIIGSNIFGKAIFCLRIVSR